MDDKIFIEIENAEEKRCPRCDTIYSFENENETLYRKITLLYFNKTTNEAKFKCKQCKSIINIKK